MLDDQRLEDFARIGADWFWETDINDRFTYFSIATSQMGMDLTGWIGRSRADFAFADPDNFARLAALESITRARRPFRDVIYRALNGDEPARWCSIGGDPIFSPEAIFEGYRGVGRDVTALFEAQAELRIKSRALDAILAAIPDGVQVIDSASRTLAVNDQLFQILDAPNQAQTGEADVTFQVLLTMAKRGEYGPGDPQAQASERARGMGELLRTQRQITYEKQLTTGRWIEGRLRALDDQGYLAIYRDITEDKKRKAELERQSALLSTVISNIDGGIAVYDKDMRLVAWNDRFADLLGIEPSLVRHGVSARELMMSQAMAGEFGPGDPKAAVERRLEGFLVGSTVSERTRPNGRTIELRRNPIPDGGTVTIYIDITDRKRIEQDLQEFNATLERRIIERTGELAETERFQRSLVASVPGMVYRSKYDGYWQIDFASEGARELLGVEPEQLTDGTVVYLGLIHPDDRARIWQEWREDSAAGRMFELEYRVRHADGSWRWVLDRAHGVRDASGEIVRLEGLVMDVTARKVAESELARARDNLSDAIESLDQNMILYDSEDRLVLMTHHIQDHYANADLHFVPGRTFGEIFRSTVESGVTTIPPDLTKEQFIADRLEAHRRADGSVTVRKLPDGRVLHISEHRSRSGGIVATGRDVTERLKLEQKLHEAKRMESIGQISAGVAHDLNNYLAIIMGNLDLLAECPRVDKQMSQLIESALAGVQRSADLTGNLLAFSRRQPLNPGVLDVGERIAHVVRRLNRTIGETITIVVDIAPDIWPVEIDGVQFDSAMAKLIDNAREGMPECGTLTIGVRNIPKDVAGSAGSGNVLIEVADTGTGMDEQTMALAFEPFFSTKGERHGVGLGLSMVHGFVNQSGGEIDLQSAPGKGTIVRLLLPRTLKRPRVTAPPAAGESVPSGTESILLVEDNDYVREAVLGQLKSLGYRVAVAESCDAALLVLEQRAGEFDLVLSDVVMPGKVDGVALAKIVHERWPVMRLLLTSGFSADAVGGQDFNFLSKPYRKADLARAVRAALV